MTVAELKQLVPLADVYELDSERRYLVKLPKGVNEAQTAACAKALEGVSEMRGRWLIAAGDVQFFEIKP
jgi:hypothetical protein